MLGLHVLGWYVLGCLTIHLHLGGEYPCKTYLYRALAHPRRGTPYSGTGHV